MMKTYIRIFVATLLLLSACKTQKPIIQAEIVQIPTDSVVNIPKVYEYIPPRYYSVPKRILKDLKNYDKAFDELKAMLEGIIEPNFERAVFISENPYFDNWYSFESFQYAIDQHQIFIEKIIDANDKSDSIDFNVKVNQYGRFNLDDIRHLPKEKKELYQKALANWAIFTYIKDTTHVFPYTNYPFLYASHDPFGIKNWSNSTVINLLTLIDQKGNCFALTAFYKILADRLNADARLCTAPQHIYIQHRDPKGDYYNVELATAGHPGDGTIQTLTHSTTEAIKSGIALRSYDTKQSIGLCLINLAKSYEHKFGSKDDDFLLKCAELVLKHDRLNLNALLLKQQILDARVTDYAIENNIYEIGKLKSNAQISQTVYELERHLALLYQLGYRQMPYDMQEIIMTGVIPETFVDKNPTPFTTIDPKDEHRKKFTTLYGGLFQEVFVTREFEPYGHFTFQTSTNKITVIDTTSQTGFLIDPVAFAYDFGARMYDARIGRFLSIDPAAKIYPSWSPYHFVRNNPILRIDPTGKWDITVHAYSDRTKYGYGMAIVTDRHGNEVYRFKVRLQGTGGSDRMVKNSDTPTGTYDIPDKNPWISGGSRQSYGPHPRLALTPESGEILESGRDLIRIHGGRQETFNSETGQWEPVDNPSLKKTQGCMRCYDEDIKTLKSITDALEANDDKEFGGKLNVVNDLEERDGKYYTPDDAKSLDNSVAGDKELGLQETESRQTVENRKKGIN